MFILVCDCPLYHHFQPVHGAHRISILSEITGSIPVKWIYFCEMDLKNEHGFILPGSCRVRFTDLYAHLWSVISDMNIQASLIVPSKIIAQSIFICVLDLAWPLFKVTYWVHLKTRQVQNSVCYVVVLFMLI